VSAPVTDRRAALRAFVRAHHPDVGGDPVAFREGLAAHRAAASAGPAPDDPRLDAPVVVVPSGHLARLERLSRRTRRRLARRPSSRVL
jgi:hypothetical protein